MMAGIVASTLRRKAFHRKQPGDSRFPISDAGFIASYSPTVSRLSSPSSSSTSDFKADFVDSGAPRLASGSQRGSRLCLVDFWPDCVNPTEPNVRLLKFETFDSLIPKANNWLLENADIELVKCETIERKLTSLDQLFSSSVMFTPNGASQALYVKGLRLWYVNNLEIDEEAVGQNVIPVEVGYLNVIPRCVDASGKYPIYENLPETYAAIDAYLTENPLEGKIVTIETVPIKLSISYRKRPEVNPDQTCFPDDYLRHIIYITRIYFRYGAPEEELIGAQDFLPDFEHGPHLYSLYPKYCPLATAMRKVKDWLKTAKHISITNIQTLEAVYRKHPDHVHTGLNFLDKVESCILIRFLRVTYVRLTSDEALECRLVYDTPSDFAYKTFIPPPVKVAMCSGAAEYEAFTATWERAKVWLSCVNRRIVSVESVVHPLTYIWHNQDGGETAVMHGDWTLSSRTEKRRGHRRCLVHIVRVYLDGDYQEPPANMIPATPMVEEIKDCACVIT